MFDAVQLAIGRCMEARGVDYQPGSYEPGSYPAFYGIVSRERAAASGYRPARAGGDQEPESAPAEELNRASVEALIGTGTSTVDIRADDGELLGTYDPDSCLSSGTAEVRPEWVELVQLEAQLRSVINPSIEASNDDPAVLDAWSEWSECMAARGHTFETPWAPYYSVWPGDEPGEEEIATAIADAECKEVTQLIPLWSSVLADIQGEMLAELMPGVLDRWSELRAADVERVQT
ncbi:hypothetical protein IM660_15910 [Ruania alkalisoli]|uniref:Uncharacterized protein n=1 Tax=Ruania alkalisoli TaxID=2779775 RepID=A0A7M1SSH4_9MICO|nr:hypothetical protein [Ruania alkalisoli]QOR70097.1 hypothetical protein IM660_15910 [Ruania alkalisoli]